MCVRDCVYSKLYANESINKYFSMNDTSLICHK